MDKFSMKAFMRTHEFQKNKLIKSPDRQGGGILQVR
jgi:hypothetical protein